MTPTTKAPPGCVWLPEAADHLGYKKSTLRKWRLKCIGPASFKVGGKVAYRIAVLNAWLAAQEAADPHSNPALSPAREPVRPRVHGRTRSQAAAA